MSIPILRSKAVGIVSWGVGILGAVGIGLLGGVVPGAEGAFECPPKLLEDGRAAIAKAEEAVEKITAERRREAAMAVLEVSKELLADAKVDQENSVKTQDRQLCLKAAARVRILRAAVQRLDRLQAD